MITDVLSQLTGLNYPSFLDDTFGFIYSSMHHFNSFVSLGSSITTPSIGFSLIRIVKTPSFRCFSSHILFTAFPIMAGLYSMRHDVITAKPGAL